MAQLQDKSVLVTSANEYMGPAIADLFETEGASVQRDNGTLYTDQDIATLLATGVPDILVANLAEPPRQANINAIEDDDWHILFDKLVHPLMRLLRAVSGPMKERGHGKIIAITSAAPLRGIPRAAAYCTARGAQNGFIRAVGLELARNNVQVNAIAQNYVRNNTYYPDGLLEQDNFIASLQRNVPTQRVCESTETAQLALYLAGPNSTHMVGQIIPFAGGWTTTTG
jgi:2-keto-3-deoxy-L-fuconate dehydrogenase